MKARCVLGLLTIFAAHAADDAGALLAKAADAIQKNAARQRNWNWQTVETRELVDRSGSPTQRFPSVTSESVIRSDGRRCNAVLAWGDGKKPYLADADPDERCQAMDAIAPPFPLAGLLGSRRAKVVERTAAAVTIDIQPDKARVKDADFVVRCGSSLRAILRLDALTLFPISIEGEVAESGCDGRLQTVNHYEPMTRLPMTSNFRKGSTFRLEWTLQKDRSGDPEKNFWISSAQLFSQPWNNLAAVLYYWGRQLAVMHEGHRLLKTTKTTAQEFVVGSELIFNK
jgi:hypothetical protein